MSQVLKEYEAIARLATILEGAKKTANLQTQIGSHAGELCIIVQRAHAPAVFNRGCVHCWHSAETALKWHCCRCSDAVDSIPMEWFQNARQRQECQREEEERPGYRPDFETIAARARVRRPPRQVVPLSEIVERRRARPPLLPHERTAVALRAKNVRSAVPR
jgi:hypothetical protein